LVQFRVDALAGSKTFTGHALSLTGITFGPHGGIAYISDELTSYFGADCGAPLVFVDNVSDVAQLTSTSNFSPRAGLAVVANVFMTGLTSSDSINLTSFTQRFSQNGPIAMAGDFNESGTVDAADYVVWRRFSGTTFSLPNDPLGGTIGPAQYNLWRANFGNSTLAFGLGAFAQVPEPSGAVLLILGSLTFYSRRSHRRECLTVHRRRGECRPTAGRYTIAASKMSFVPMRLPGQTLLATIIAKTINSTVRASSAPTRCRL